MVTTKITTRFAPAPTGALHLGGARTALFNYLFAKHHQGRFLLRIEDTDKARSTKQAEQSILSGLKWLGLDWHEEAFYQSAAAERHCKIAHQLVADGKAYYCVCSPEQLDAQRKKALAEKRPLRYNRNCRDAQHRTGAIRIKTPADGASTINDQIQGEITTQNSQIDDFIILRSDASPTYMLCVVVDDHDMEISHIIRGSDHLTNAARQAVIYQALGWAMPIFAHVPLILGPDGSKLSKRHGAEDISIYQEKGYLPDAMRNYLVRLGWAHGDDEIFDTQQAIAWFSLEGIGKSPARFDPTKLDSLNGYYLRNKPDLELLNLFLDLNQQEKQGKNADYQSFIPVLRLIAEQSKTLTQFAQNARFLLNIEPQSLAQQEKQLINLLIAELDQLDWKKPALERSIRDFADQHGGLKKIAQSMRVSLVGQKNAPSIFEIMIALGREETLKRMKRSL